MNTSIFGRKFFDRDPVSVCKDLLGKFLVIGNKRFIITEVEAYDGLEDEACHARHGKTSRNAPMFGYPGYRYVYMIYGMYYMLNIVTGPGTHPSAVLIRGLGMISSENCIGNCNNVHISMHKDLCGPGKLTKKLGITKEYSGKKADKKTGLWIEESGIVISSFKTSPRIGIDYASYKRRNKYWRFYVEDFG